MPKSSKPRREPKIRRLMLSQPAEERIQSSLDIEDLLANVVHRQVADYMEKFSATIENKLGLTRDDLMNDVREQIWKGLLTHSHADNPYRKKANLKTYLDTIIKNRFLLLYKQSTLRKYNSIEYYSDASQASGAKSEFLEVEETGESLLERRQEFMKDLVLLSNEDRAIMKDLVLGYSIAEMMARTGLSRTQVIGAINRVQKASSDRRLKSE